MTSHDDDNLEASAEEPTADFWSVLFAIERIKGHEKFIYCSLIRITLLKNGKGTMRIIIRQALRAMHKLLGEIYNFYENSIITCKGVSQFVCLDIASRDEHTLTSDFRSVLIMKRSSWDRKKTLPLFPGEDSSLRASFPQMDIM